jgi:LuxR family maltose regulon positive regulatory protein
MSTLDTPRKTATDPAQLTKREIEVLTLVIEGHPSKAVADRLFLSQRTVEFHLVHVCKKLHVKNRLQACRRASQMGLISTY